MSVEPPSLKVCFVFFRFRNGSFYDKFDPDFNNGRPPGLALPAEQFHLLAQTWRAVRPLLGELLALLHSDEKDKHLRILRCVLQSPGWAQIRGRLPASLPYNHHTRSGAHQDRLHQSLLQLLRSEPPTRRERRCLQQDPNLPTHR